MANFIIHQNNKIYYRVTGNGYPVVFLHGFLENSNMWERVINKFEDDMTAITIDLPCHGKSYFNGDFCSMDFMAETVRLIINKLNIDNPFVIGHSMGGYVALELAKKVKCKPVLLHSNFWADSSDKKRDRDRVVEVVKKNVKFFIQQAIPNLFDKANIEKYANEISKIIKNACEMDSNQIIAATLGMKDRADNSDTFKSLNIPLIQGEFDTTIPLEKTIKELNKIECLNNMNLIENCGHMGFIEQTQELTEVLKTILNSKNSKNKL